MGVITPLILEVRNTAEILNTKETRKDTEILSNILKNKAAEGCKSSAAFTIHYILSTPLCPSLPARLPIASHPLIGARNVDLVVAVAQGCECDPLPNGWPGIATASYG